MSEPDVFQWGNTPQVMVDKVYKMQKALRVLEVYYGDGRFNRAVLTIGKEMFPTDASIIGSHKGRKYKSKPDKDTIYLTDQIRNAKPNPDIFKIYLYNRFSIFSRRILGMEKNK